MRLTNEQLAAIQAAAQPIIPQQRERFLFAMAEALALYDTVS